MKNPNIKKLSLALVVGVTFSSAAHAQPQLVHQYCHKIVLLKKGPNAGIPIQVNSDFCGRPNGTGNVFGTCCGQIDERIKRVLPRYDAGLCFQTQPAKKGGC